MSLDSQTNEAIAKNADGKMVACEACFREGVELIRVDGDFLSIEDSILCKDPVDCMKNWSTTDAE